MLSRCCITPPMAAPLKMTSSSSHAALVRGGGMSNCPVAARCVLSSCYELSLSSVEAKELSSVAVSQKCSHRSIGQQQQLTTTMTKARNEGLKLQSSSSVTRSTRFLTTSIPRLHANNCIALLIDSQLYLLASCPACPAFALACKQQPSTYDMSTWNTYWSVGTPQRLL